MASGHAVKGAPKCPVFPKNNPWNQRVDKLPLVKNSAAIVRSIGAGGGVHPDFGSGLYDGAPIGIPYTTVSKPQKKVRVSFDYSDESDKGPYPVPRERADRGRPQLGRRSPRDRGRPRRLQALRALRGLPAERRQVVEGRLGRDLEPEVEQAAAEGMDLGGRRRPADPAGARALRGPARRGGIDHALRFTANRTRKAFIYPARHFASSLTDPDLPAMGQRLRLKASFNVNGFPKQARVVLVALKRYGMILADNGSSWYITGAPSKGWNNDDLHTLGKVKGSRLRGGRHIDAWGLRVAATSLTSLVLLAQGST